MYQYCINIASMAHFCSPSVLTALLVVRNMMQEATDPQGDHSPRHTSCSQTIPVGTLRPKVAHSRALLGQAHKEPPFMGRHCMILGKWEPVLASLESLITKVAALESLLEGALPLLLQPPNHKLPLLCWPSFGQTRFACSRFRRCIVQCCLP